MEDLNKQQLILLVLLVSFVTSIATGIITVSLLNKAPVEVTQTINRVVERTVETVVPEGAEPEERVVTVRETVVVTEEDRVVDAIATNRNNIVRIFTRDGEFVVMGVVRSTVGEVVTVRGSYSQSDSLYIARFENGDEFPIIFDRTDEQGGASFFTLRPEEQRDFAVGSFSSQDLQLGQTIVSISGSDRHTILTGLVSDLVEGREVITNLSTAGLVRGTVLLNLSGDVVALRNDSGVFISIKTLLSLVQTGGSEGNRNAASAGQAVE